MHIFDVRTATRNTERFAVHHDTRRLVGRDIVRNMFADSMHVRNRHKADFILAAFSDYFVSDLFDIFLRRFSLLGGNFGGIFYKAHVRIVGTFTCNPWKFQPIYCHIYQVSRRM